MEEKKLLCSQLFKLLVLSKCFVPVSSKHSTYLELMHSLHDEMVGYAQVSHLAAKGGKVTPMKVSFEKERAKRKLHSFLLKSEKVALQSGMSKLHSSSDLKWLLEDVVCISLSKDSLCLFIQTAVDYDVDPSIVFSSFLGILFIEHSTPFECCLPSSMVMITSTWSDVVAKEDDGRDYICCLFKSTILGGGPVLGCMMGTIKDHVNGHSSENHAPWTKGPAVHASTRKGPVVLAKMSDFEHPHTHHVDDEAACKKRGDFRRETRSQHKGPVDFCFIVHYLMVSSCIADNKAASVQSHTKRCPTPRDNSQVDGKEGFHVLQPSFQIAILERVMKRTNFAFCLSQAVFLKEGELRRINLADNECMRNEPSVHAEGTIWSVQDMPHVSHVTAGLSFIACLPENTMEKICCNFPSIIQRIYPNYTICKACPPDNCTLRLSRQGKRISLFRLYANFKEKFCGLATDFGEKEAPHAPLISRSSSFLDVEKRCSMVHVKRLQKAMSSKGSFESDVISRLTLLHDNGLPQTYGPQLSCKGIFSMTFGSWPTSMHWLMLNCFKRQLTFQRARTAFQRARTAFFGSCAFLNMGMHGSLVHALLLQKAKHTTDVKWLLCPSHSMWCIIRNGKESLLPIFYFEHLGCCYDNGLCNRIFESMHKTHPSTSPLC